MSRHQHRKIWRIAEHSRTYAARDISGRSGEHFSGRWNSKGKRIVYAASTIALATLEKLVHLVDNTIRRNVFLVKIEVPVEVWNTREIVAASSLDVTWVAEPPGRKSIEIGDRWLASSAGPLLLVPSVIVPEEYNVLINPAHPAFVRMKSVVTRQVIYDPRLFKNPSPP